MERETRNGMLWLCNHFFTFKKHMNLLTMFKKYIYFQSLIFVKEKGEMKIGNNVKNCSYCTTFRKCELDLFISIPNNFHFSRYIAY